MNDKANPNENVLDGSTSSAKEHWAGIEASQKAEKESRKKAELVTDPKRIRRIRVNGVIMSILSLLLLIPSLTYIAGAGERIRTYSTEISPSLPYPNLLKLDVDSSPLVAVVALVALVGLICGISRVKRGQRGPSWLPMSTFVGFFILLVIAFSITEKIKEPIIDSLHVSQHEWAEKRYGITYDEITIEKHGTGKHITQFQDEIIEDGTVVGRICEREDETIVFCGVNSIREMPVLVD